MKRIANRAVSVLLLALLVLLGLTVYALRYLDDGGSWALAYPRLNSQSTGVLTDRDGETLAAFGPEGYSYADDALTRRACYHVTGDFYDRTGVGAAQRFLPELSGFSPLTGTTVAEHSELSLTVDASLCRTAYTALDGRSGAVMLLNYRTGELLCMVSAPTVDPADPESEIADGAFLNRCLSASFTPGSVFKLVTSAAAIESIPDIFERSYYCYGERDIAGVVIHCSGTHYTQSFEEALANSCNSAFAAITVSVGQESMVSHVKSYGFLSSQSLDGIPSVAGSYPTDFVGDPELAWSGIGQSTDLVNPYALLRFVAAVANDGVLVEPHLLPNDSPKKLRLVKEDTALRLKEMMNYDVTAHYEPERNFPGLSLCAKTGTAELGDGTSHAWFTGFLLDESHPYAFVVLLERGGGGLSQAGPVANALLQAAVN